MGEVILVGEPMALLLADEPGDLKDVTHFTKSMSGAEVNVAIGLTRLNHKVEYMTRLGDDPFGQYIEESLRNNNIGTSYVQFDNEYKTGIQLKNYVLDGSDPYAPYYRKNSAASRISIKDIEKIDFEGVKLVHITGILPALSETTKEAVFYLMKKAQGRGITVSFDPNLRPALWPSKEIMISTLRELMQYADIILPGIAECKVLFGTDDIHKIVEEINQYGQKTIIIKQGSKGAYVYKDGKELVIPGFKVDHVVDTVGAGDGFASGVLSGILDGISIEESVRRGNAIGAIQVMHRGDNEGLPTMTQLQNFISKNS